jgi:hypothetical protein
MVTEEKTRLIEIQDRLIELYVEQKEAKEAHNWHRLFIIEIAVNYAKAELTELRRRDPEKEL